MRTSREGERAARGQIQDQPDWSSAHWLNLLNTKADSGWLAPGPIEFSHGTMQHHAKPTKDSKPNPLKGSLPASPQALVWCSALQVNADHEGHTQGRIAAISLHFCRVHAEVQRGMGPEAEHGRH